MRAAAYLLDDLTTRAAELAPEAPALSDGQQTLAYAALETAIDACANGLLTLGLQRGERVAFWLDKRTEAVIAPFAAVRAGGAFVPINPLLKGAQVEHILRDCNVRILVTSPERHALLAEVLPNCSALRHVVLTGAGVPGVIAWRDLLAATPQRRPKTIDSDMAAIFYTSGSTGRPKGVMLTHRNLVAGAASVASYLGNHAGDSLLAALPLSFDAGFSQLSTAFHSGARVVLHNYLLPQDLLKALARERITGLTAVPPLYMQLAQQPWPAGIDAHLRYFANTGGRMPLNTLQQLRAALPRSQPFLMYGLTEAFRSTYLPPEEVDARPDSIGKAIPNVEVLVLRPDGSECAVDEPGELVHRGALVSQGYWNDPATTAQRFKPLPRRPGQVLDEIAVFSGDTVRRDADGFLYFIGRHDEMIKTSGYRVSPTEIEEAAHATGLVAECCACGIDDEALGQRIRLAAVPAGAEGMTAEALMQALRLRLPGYMVPAHIEVVAALPRNANGKLDRQAMSAAATLSVREQ
ncbi:MAG: acyl-CoA ligase (AMP-forming), exosortase A system-associated [Rhodocyclaceae bacterium]|nr:acyl-CoA ligase (AMP-forming), exosortase A system-associated [Rhodocyclaceae bacterium]